MGYRIKSLDKWECHFMEPLEILQDSKQIMPYFFPIFSADEHRIIGYEVIGKFITENNEIDLKSFLADDSIPEEYRNKVDDILLEKALEHAIQMKDDVMLYINRNVDLLLNQDSEHLLNILKKYEDQGIALDRIVISMTKRTPIDDDFDYLDHFISYYRTYGIKIAIDNLGEANNNLEQIGKLAPNILRIDLKALRSSSNNHHYQEILYSLSMLARKIGATLLFENIDMDFQLQFAWRNGGRYYQGDYLHKAGSVFVNRDILKEKLKEKCHQFITYEKKKLHSLHTITEKFNETMTEYLQKNHVYESYVPFLTKLATKLDHVAFRLYICNEDGFQQTPNIFKKNKNWIQQDEYLHKNWSWRPYFLEHIMRMKSNKKGLLSDLYTDIETGETIRTFSFPLTATEYLFADLSYDFLYERDGLL
ncbi:EAL-associated domain-containing protein [Cytobacillus kochii]|uniref:EAL-associated domain-containing protein n=1 Tax=Cytobacillus kochii TaxID=859143 RepID=UPI00402ACF60